MGLHSSWVRDQRKGSHVSLPISQHIGTQKHPRANLLCSIRDYDSEIFYSSPRDSSGAASWPRFRTA